MAQSVGQIQYELYYDGVRMTTNGKDNFPLTSIARHEHSDLRKALKALKPDETHEWRSTGGTNMVVRCVQNAPEKPLISPFIASSFKHLDITDATRQQVKAKCPSFGLSSYGYDIRPGRHWSVLKHVPGRIVSTIEESGPEFLKPADYLENIEADFIDIPPGGCALGVSMERMAMPDNVTAVCMAKSTLARLFLEAAVTPLEASWSGFITLEFFNKSPNTIRLYAGVGVMQICFHVSNERCMVSYEDRGGKYQDQPAVPVPGTF